MVRNIHVKGPAGRLRLSDGGVGDLPIVFIPSLAGTLRQWQAQVDHARGQHRSVVVELRGHGASDVPRDRDYSLEAMARDVEAVASALELTRFVLVGHSMGGGVALAYAAAHPDRIAGLLLADPIDDPSARPADAIEPFIDRLRSGNYQAEIEGYWDMILEGARPEVKSAVLADLRATPPVTVLDSMVAMGSFNASAALAMYAGPILSLITRFNDVPSSFHKISTRVRALPLSGTSHWLHMDDPVAFNRAMDDFVLTCV